MIDVGLVGFGLGGRAFHAPIIHQVPGMRLAAILQRNGNASQEFYPDAKVVRDLDELLALKSISMIAVATPNETHFPYAKRALEAGKHVVVDKPFTNTLAEARELVALAQKKGLVLSVYQDRRFDGDFRTVQKLLADKTLGKLIRFETAFDRCRPVVKHGGWKELAKPGSGVFFDLGPHLIDQVLLLFGAPEGVLADIRKERDGTLTDDAFDVTFFYKNGFRAFAQQNMLATAPRPHYRITGSGGVYLKETLDPQEALLRADKPATGENWGVESENEWGTLTLFSDESLTPKKFASLRGDYRDYYAQVRDAIEGKGAAPVSFDQALQLMYTLELCEQSSRRRAVLPWVYSAA